jgi:hypothetical protein
MKERWSIGSPTVQVEAEISGTLAVVELRGETSFAQAVRLVQDVLVRMRERGVQELLIEALGLKLDRIPDVGQRYFMARDWAVAARGALRLAMVVQPELVDPEKFGMLALRNAGLVGEVFGTREEALSWLEGARSG